MFQVRWYIYSTQASHQACETQMVGYNNHAWFWITRNKVWKQIKMWWRVKMILSIIFVCLSVCLYVCPMKQLALTLNKTSNQNVWILLTLISVSTEAKYLLHQSILSKSSSSSSTVDCFRLLFSAVFCSFVVILRKKKRLAYQQSRMGSLEMLI